MKLLIARGAEVDARDADSSTALQYPKKEKAQEKRKRNKEVCLHFLRSEETEKQGLKRGGGREGESWGYGER